MNLDTALVFTGKLSLEVFVVHYVLGFLQNVYVYWKEKNFSSRW